MNWIDGHLDLAYLAVRGRDLTVRCDDPGEGCISLPDLREGGVRLAFGTIFIEPGAPDQPFGYCSNDDVDGAQRAALRQIEVYEALEREGHIRIVRSRGDLAGLSDTGPLSIVILMEGADAIAAPEDARAWFDRGVRIVGLTWAMGTRYAGGNAAPGPLTAAGRELVAALDELGIVHDLSHLADEAIEDLLAIARGRIIASHSNARALLSAQPAGAVPGVSPGAERHLRDEAVRAIASRGGMIGINLFSKFLAHGRRAMIGDVADHIEHIAEIMGHRRGVGLGSDADGGFPPTQLADRLDHPRRWGALLEALASRGWSADERANFAHDNWLRFLREALP